MEIGAGPLHLVDRTPQGIRTPETYLGFTRLDRFDSERLVVQRPYDFRLPTMDRLRQAYWNPRSPKVFTGRPLGVGWAINFPTALRRLGVHRHPRLRVRPPGCSS